MPPVNDSFASAVSIALPYEFFGDNIGATTEAGEPQSWGHTIWWKWICPASRKVTASVRNRTTLNTADEFTIDCDLQVFRQGSIPSLSGLILVAKAIAGEASFEAAAGSTYYFRADGRKGKEGKIAFTLEGFKELKLSNCTACGAAPKTGETCLGVVTPDITSHNRKSFGDFPRGSYRVAYCGGAWNYRDGWVVTRTPESNPQQTWPGNILRGYFLVVLSTNVSGVAYSARQALGEGTIPGTIGYPNEDAAEAGAKCAQLIFNHLGGPIALDFSDNEYFDNIGGRVLPSYALYRAIPNLKLDTAYFEFADRPDAMRGFIRVRNLGTVYFVLTFTLQTTGGVTSIITGSPASKRIESLQTVDIPFTFFVTSGKTDCLLTIKVTDGFNTISDITVDLTPVLVIPEDSIEATSITCSGPKKKIDFGIKNIGYGATWDLVATLRNTGGVESVWGPSCTVEENSVNVGVIVPFSSPFFQVQPVSFKALTTTGVTDISATVDLVDGGLTHPPAAFNVTV